MTWITLFDCQGMKQFEYDDNTVSGGYQYDICLFVWIKTHFINLETASLLKMHPADFQQCLISEVYCLISDISEISPCTYFHDPECLNSNNGYLSPLTEHPVGIRLPHTLPRVVFIFSLSAISLLFRSARTSWITFVCPFVRPQEKSGSAV